MDKHGNRYLLKLGANVKSIIDNILLDKHSDLVVNAAFNHHLENTASFQRYYFKTLANRTEYFRIRTFFHEFKKQYALQGIDNRYLDKLEASKGAILALIDADELTELYFDYFARAGLTYSSGPVTKDLGSFFAKLVHTFRPHEYCALDNPIKCYMGLGKESFFIAFLVISKSYLQWVAENQDCISTMRNQLQQLNKSNVILMNELTDLKLLDMIFWYKSNIIKLKTLF